MKRVKPAVKWLALTAGVLLLLVLGTGPWVVPRLIRGMMENSPIPMTAASIRSGFPFGVVIEDLTVADPSGVNPFLLKVERLTAQAPWWGLFIRPLPLKLTLERPHLLVHSENAADLIDLMTVHPSMNWLFLPGGGLEENQILEQGRVVFRLPAAPLELKVQRGRLEAIEPQLREEAPLFIADHLELSVGVSGFLLNPTLGFSGYGVFVTEAGEPIGSQHIRFSARPLTSSMDGFIRLRHERLEDFRNLYAYAPSPIYIEGGLADFSAHFEVTGGNRLKFIARTLVQNLDLDGYVGEVHWGDIMHAVEDENRRYEWVVPVEGKMDDPDWNPHDYVLREVEYKMKERAAARGLRIEEPLFFYSDME